MNEAAEAVAALIGARVRSVVFVMDYLVLGFDGSRWMNILVWPEMRRAGETIVVGAAEYTDELCALIDKVVTAVTIAPNETICMSFDNAAELRLLLQPCADGGERLMLTAPEHYLFVL